MRLPVAVFAALLALPASAQAGVVAVEGTQIVYRADPGADDNVIFTEREDDGVVKVTPLNGKVRLGPGCAERPLGNECPTAGMAGLTVFSGDGTDHVEATVSL